MMPHVVRDRTGKKKAPCQAPQGPLAPCQDRSPRCRVAVRTQCDRRWAEQQVRQEAALFAQRWGTTRTAHILELSPRTLRHWRKRRREDRLIPVVRGRSPVECPVPVRNEVIQFLHRVTGPSVGLPALRCLFPGIRRCVLADLLMRYRRIWRRR